MCDGHSYLSLTVAIFVRKSGRICTEFFLLGCQSCHLRSQKITFYINPQEKQAPCNAMSNDTSANGDAHSSNNAPARPDTPHTNAIPAVASDHRKRNGFQDGNKAKKTATETKKKRLEDNDESVHPRIQAPFRIMITQGKRRITEEKLPDFKDAMCVFIETLQHEPCVDASKSMVVKGCNCLMEVLDKESNKEIAANLVCSHYNMEFNARNIILTEKIRKVTEQKLLKRRKKRTGRQTNCI